MKLNLETYLKQKKAWPEKGRHILAQYDAESVIVYQAFNPKIAQFAIKHGHFGGDFGFNRMSWIKTNFLWMMYRSAWGTSENQEITLAIRLKRDRFDEILAQAVHTDYVAEVYGTRSNYDAVAAHSMVRLQWDPDHAPSSEPLERRAIQLGLKGAVLAQYSEEWIVEISDISEFVAQQRPNAKKRNWGNLLVPIEQVYPVENADIAKTLGLSAIQQKD